MGISCDVVILCHMTTVQALIPETLAVLHTVFGKRRYRVALPILAIMSFSALEVEEDINETIDSAATVSG